MGKRRSLTPIRFEQLVRGSTQDARGRVVVDTTEMMKELITEINERFEILADDATGRGASTSQSALTFVSGELAQVPVLGSGVLFQFSSQKNATIPGFAGGYDGRVVVIQNTGTFTYTIAHESQSALPAERVTARTGASPTLAANGGLVLIYNGVTSRWLPIGAQL